jgi:hypothetical protein
VRKGCRYHPDREHCGSLSGVLTVPEQHLIAPAPTRKPSRPNKPNPDFPLFAHAAGVWAKKIRRKLHYFGPWGDPDGSLKI